MIFHGIDLVPVVAAEKKDMTSNPIPDPRTVTVLNGKEML